MKKKNKNKNKSKNKKTDKRGVQLDKWSRLDARASMKHFW